MSADIILQDCLKTYTHDQDKAVTPAETVARVRERLTKAGLNVLAKTERIDNGRLDIPVYVSVCGDDAREVMPTKKQMGKGATSAQAEASAVMEMIERFSFFHFVRNERFIRATYDQVKDRALPFEHIAASVHHDTSDLDRARRALDGVEMNWTPARNLSQDREYLVPLTWFYEINEFNGPAAGNRLEEAIMQGVAELVERHVCALVARSKPILPSIDPASLETEVARELVRKFERNGIRLFIKDFTLNMGIPTVGALGYDPSTFPEHSEIVYTAGTATDPEKALIRALTEVAQLGGDFNTRSNFVASGLPKYTRLDQAGYITQESPVISIASLPNIAGSNIKNEIETTVSLLAARGFDIYAINLTHPRIGVPAVYTIAPGAHFRERAVGSSVPFFAAKILAEQAGPVEAAEGLARLGRLYPDAYFVKFYQGRMLIDQGRPDEAVDLLRQALKQDPSPEDQAGILTYLGLALKELEQYDRALEVLQQSADIDEERRDTYNLLGFCLFKTKRHEEAVAAFKEVLRIDPGSGIDYANIGVNYREMGRRDEAAAYFKTALELDPALEWVWEALAKLS